VTPWQRASLVTAVFAAGPAILVGVVVLLLAGWIAGLIAVLVVGVGLALWVRLGGDRRVLATLHGHDADPVTDARLWNLAEGLSINAGVRQPRLLVVDSPALNAMAAGGRPGRAVVAVTSGLLTELERIELEAVLAAELMQIRRQETVPATVLVATFGLGRRLALPADWDAQVDQAAVTLTRYPPALAAALEKLETKGAAVSGQAGSTAHLWFVDPTDGTGRGRLTTRERIEALREL
jgi:heat shock protein HtpX